MEINLIKITILEDVLNTPDDSGKGYFIGGDLKYPNEMKEITKNFPICPQKKVSPQDNIGEYMNERKTIDYTQLKKLSSDWTDKNFLIP